MIKSPEEGHEDSRLFKNKIFLDTLTTPKGITIVGRDNEIKTLSEYLLSYQDGLVVPLISVYGKSGTGKSATVELVCKHLEESGGISYRFINLRKARTVFGCANTILHELGGPTLKSADGMNIAIEKINERLEAIVIEGVEKGQEGQKRLFVLVLDEFDVLFHDRRGSPSDFVYSLLLIEEDLRKKGHQICIVAISNRFVADYDLDDRVKSRTGSSEIYFPSYSKKELMEILKNRQARAFTQAADPDILEYCARLSAGDHGDARRAIDLLRRAAEIASSSPRNHEEGAGQNQRPVTIIKDHVEAAFAELQKDKITTVVSTFPYQLKLVIAALVRISYLTDQEWFSTSTLFGQYKFMNKRLFWDGAVKPLTRRRFAELLTELRNVGLVDSHTSSEGRYGYHAKYRLTEDPELIGSSTWIHEAWDNLVDLKERRRDFLGGKLFRKVRRDFDKIREHDGDTILTEMNDYSWNLRVYDRIITDTF